MDCRSKSKSDLVRLKEGLCKLAKSKGDPSKVNPALARQALKDAGGVRQGAYSRYIILRYRQTGSLAPGCDNKDLQAFYEKEGLL